MGGSARTEGGRAVARLWIAVQSRFARDDEGASIIEYALLVSLIAVVAIVAVTVLGEQVSEKFSDIADEL